MKLNRTEKAIAVLLAFATIYILLQMALAAIRPPKPVNDKPQDTSMAYDISEPLFVEKPTTSTTSTTEETTTTTEAPTTTTIRASRGVQRTTDTGAQDDDFWRRLANCESKDGTGGNGGGYFQFSPDTARKVGIDGSESYETQRAAAISWASSIHPNEGTSSGWPHCWWVALS